MPVMVPGPVMLLLTKPVLKPLTPTGVANRAALIVTVRLPQPLEFWYAAAQPRSTYRHW